MQERPADFEVSGDVAGVLQGLRDIGWELLADEIEDAIRGGKRTARELAVSPRSKKASFPATEPFSVSEQERLLIRALRAYTADAVPLVAEVLRASNELLGGEIQRVTIVGPQDEKGIAVEVGDNKAVLAELASLFVRATPPDPSGSKSLHSLNLKSWGERDADR